MIWSDWRIFFQSLLGEGFNRMAKANFALHPPFDIENVIIQRICFIDSFSGMDTVALEVSSFLHLTESLFAKGLLPSPYLRKYCFYHASQIHACTYQTRPNALALYVRHLSAVNNRKVRRRRQHAKRTRREQQDSPIL